MAPHTSHQRGEHLCVDYFAEPGYGSTGDENGAMGCGATPTILLRVLIPLSPPGYLMYLVETYNVASYTNFRTVSCAMCRSTSFGSIFTRWGKRTCPAGTTTIYSHVMAAPHFTHSGGGANQLCMTNAPLWLNTNTADRSGAQIYSVEVGG